MVEGNKKIMKKGHLFFKLKLIKNVQQYLMPKMPHRPTVAEELAFLSFFPSFNSSCIISCIFIIAPSWGPKSSHIIHWPKLHFPKSSPAGGRGGGMGTCVRKGGAWARWGGYPLRSLQLSRDRPAEAPGPYDKRSCQTEVCVRGVFPQSIL